MLNDLDSVASDIRRGISDIEDALYDLEELKSNIEENNELYEKIEGLMPGGSLSELKDLIDALVDFASSKVQMYPLNTWTQRLNDASLSSD